MLRRRCASATPACASTHTPRSSGPRCAMASPIAPASAVSSSPCRCGEGSSSPANPHMIHPGAAGAARYRAPGRPARHRRPLYRTTGAAASVARTAGQVQLLGAIALRPSHYEEIAIVFPGGERTVEQRAHLRLAGTHALAQQLAVAGTLALPGRAGKALHRVEHLALG